MCKKSHQNGQKSEWNMKNGTNSLTAKRPILFFFKLHRMFSSTAYCNITIYAVVTRVYASICIAVLADSVSVSLSLSLAVCFSFFLPFISPRCLAAADFYSFKFCLFLYSFTCEKFAIYYQFGSVCVVLFTLNKITVCVSVPYAMCYSAIVFW